MAKVIKLRKGLDINLGGKVEGSDVWKCEPSTSFGLVPDDFPGLVPRVVVREGDKVLAGDPLFVDKQHPEVRFVSPVSGTVRRVERGERRKLLCVHVKSDGEFLSRQFDVTQDVRQLMLQSGMFAYLRMRPYDRVANPQDQPKSIFVSAYNSMPLSQDFELALRGNEAEFQAGISALARIAKVHLGIGARQTAKALTEAQDCEVTIWDGPAPCGNVGVHINHLDPINKGEVVWTMGAEEVIFLGRVMLTGRVNFRRVIAFVGNACPMASHYPMTVGQRIDNLPFKTFCWPEWNFRTINGNVMTGVVVDKDHGYLAAHATEVTAIREGDDDDELLGWIMPRSYMHSASRCYTSWLRRPSKYGIHDYDARIKGGQRHMIMSGEYDRVFPMDIYPEYLIKAIIAGDIDRQEALGIYEVAPEDFAIAEYVDSSKLELQRLVRQALDILYKENA